MSKEQVQTPSPNPVREGANQAPERRVVIEDTGAMRLVREVDEGMIEIALYKYPLYPYGNYIKNTIALYIDDGKLEYYTVRMNWGGTGRDDYGHVYLTEEEVEEMRKRMLSIKSLDDFNDLVGLVRELINKREKKIEEVLDRVVEAVRELIHTDETLRNLEWLLEEKELLREKIREWAST